AAHAGEYGKGFAVVADEVRKLAVQSAAATKEVDHLIKGIQTESRAAIDSITKGADKVKTGNVLAHKTNEAMLKIANGIEQVSHEMGQIAAETGSQRKQSEVISKTVEDVANQSKNMTYVTEE